MVSAIAHPDHSAHAPTPKMNVGLFEPLGSNCEFGFVLRDLGDVRPSVFRWTSIAIESLSDLLESDFQDCFELSNVRPHTADMVMASRFEWAFHSALKSDGCGNFSLPEKKLTRLFQIERKRVYHEIDAFRTRLRDGNLVCVFSADGVTDDQICRLRSGLDGIAGNQTNRLLVVGGQRTDKDELGTSKEIAPRVFRGTVLSLANYATANEYDVDNWHAVLENFAERG